MQAKLSRKPMPYEIKPGSVIENVANARRLAETTLGPTVEEPATNTGSGSGDEDDEIAEQDCQVISNDKSTEFILATVTEEATIPTVMATLTSPAPLADPNGNNDSGYAPSQPETIIPESPRRVKHQHQAKRNGATTLDTELR
ncbi:hypothetical protein MML48_4g00012594 [Holotrichia oblita]|uniref:Uncharacterized protein n=1 Tax=Holotrichia oblita TaxID=644536 RepID=A0ACB9TBN6_HOLOL|nr:hypothetical protein MML48_4g00012594 [Holotrichia oblita]